MLKLQPIGITSTLGSKSVFATSLFKLKTVVPPAHGASITVGVRVEQVSKNLTLKVCG